MNLIIDLDGTLIDSKLRLYTLFTHLAPMTGLSYTQYWEFKQNKTSNELILRDHLGQDESTVERFVRDWMKLIETPDFLALDTNFVGMHETLSHLKERADLYVCTARQDAAAAVRQLETLDLRAYFTAVLVTEMKASKHQLIEQFVPSLDETDWMVGDTGKDIQTGKSLGLRTCAVLSGFLNRVSLTGYGPTLILDSLTQFTL